MGQQQLLLIILGVIIVGIAIAVGLSLFSAQSQQANHDAIINDLNNISANAYQFYIRPASMGGGANSYTGYTIPSRMQSNENAGYSVTTASGPTCVILGTSASVATATIQASVDATGHVAISTSYAW